MPPERSPQELRPLAITRGYMDSAEGSVLIEAGKTRVICTASVEKSAPAWMAGKGTGWITAEYGMLPRSTSTRKPRDSARGRADARALEIGRIIGRSMRQMVDLVALGEKTVVIDCDVVGADGGTRCAAVTGACVALIDALEWMRTRGMVGWIPAKFLVAAVSVGIVDGRPALDLDYSLDSRADVDMNVVMDSRGKLIELQGTAEREPFGRAELSELLDLAENGIKKIFEIQRRALGAEIVAQIESAAV